MSSYTQTIARIGSGFFVLGSLTWLLWPEDFRETIDPEPLFGFCVALVVWLATEIKQSEEVVKSEELNQGEKIAPAKASPNDARVAREFLRLHAEEFRVVLKEHDSFQLLDYEYHNEIDEILHRRSTGKLLFQSTELDVALEDFLVKLRHFRRAVAEGTTPRLIGEREVVGFKPDSFVAQGEYDRLLALSRAANKLSEEAWRSCEQLLGLIRRIVPEAYDDQL